MDSSYAFTVTLPFAEVAKSNLIPVMKISGAVQFFSSYEQTFRISLYLGILFS